MEKIKANPKDVDALMGLGDAFFQAGQYAVAGDWLTKLVAIDPKNVRALLALGAAEFNAGDATDAEAHWKQVLGLDEKNVEAHYDLGFLYLQRQPPDLVGVRREWQRVVELAPGTEVAQNVQAHLDAIASQGATPSAAASASASPASP
jgi:Flp pilus assembly protein TadD